jgi:hypothetical protein
MRRRLFRLIRDERMSDIASKKADRTFDCR